MQIELIINRKSKLNYLMLVPKFDTLFTIIFANIIIFTSSMNCNNFLTCLINRTCEICGSIAHNVAGAIEVQMTEQFNESSDPSIVPPVGPSPPSETRNFWQGHRFLNFLLACMVFAFVISWLFHFNVPS